MSVRNYSKSGYSHVMVRGLSKQIIFESDDDKQHFIDLLKKYSTKYNIKIVCYCLMVNHVHILIFDKDYRLSKMMQFLCSSYSMYFNTKYDRCGTLFQRPFKSKPIESESYLVSAFRYIINNPEKDHICPAHHYKWSSYQFYDYKNYFTDSSVIKDLIGSKEDMLNYLNDDENNYEYKKYFDDCYSSITDNEAIKIIQKEFSFKTASSIRNLNSDDRNKAVLQLRSLGLSIRQIERITGISKGIVQRIV